MSFVKEVKNRIRLFLYYVLERDIFLPSIMHQYRVISAENK